MSLDYIIDGYNIIYSDDKFLSKTLEGKRNNLINFLSDKRPQGSSKNKTIVVFDGREEYPGDTRARKSVFRGIDIVFSVGRSADEEIVEIASSCRNQIIIVTDDKGIRRMAACGNVRFMGCVEFISKAKPVNHGISESKREKLKDANKINEELKKIWFK